MAKVHERVGNRPARGPALRAKSEGTRSVIRRSDRRPPSSFRGVIDWGYVGYVLAWVATFAVLLHVAMGGGA